MNVPEPAERSALPEGPGVEGGVRGPGALASAGARDWIVRILYLAALLAVFGTFLYTVRSVLSPLVLFLLLLFLATPLYGTRIYPTLLIAVGALLLLWLLHTIGVLLAPFILALILAYVLDPLVDRLERYRLRRSWAILALGVPVAGIFVLVVFVGLPAVGREFTGFVNSFVPSGVEEVTARLEGLRARIIALGIPGITAESLPEIRELDVEGLVAFLTERREAIAQRIWQAVLGFGRGLGFLLGIFGYLVLTPVLAYYLLRDYDRLRRAVVELIPPERRMRWLDLAGAYDRLLARYLRGQVLVALCVGLLTYLGFWIVGYPYPFLLGALAAVFNVVPYLGIIVSTLPALVIAFASGAVLVSLVKVALVVLAINVVESTVLSPWIVGGSVGLNPVWVMLALTVFGFFFGFVGLLIAVPLAVLLKVLLTRALGAYRDSIYYGRSPTSPSP